jgi:multiple sugar transport system ATP-binding protein
VAQVSLERITKQFGDFTAVNDVSMVIEDGKFTVLVGPSGCGKTTTLRMVAGLEEATSGEIRIGERVVNDVPPKDRDIAMVFQNYALYPHMDVFNNMAFGLKLRKYPKEEIKRRVNDAAAMLGIEAKLKSKPRELSGGQRQRVAVGRAIVRNPKVFLFDEPLSNLDAKLRVQMRTELEQLHHKLKTTTIYVTHDQVEAMTLGDRIAVMKDGVIHQYAPPQETYDHPANQFVAGFIGSPAMNFLSAHLSQENGHIRVQGDGLVLTLPRPHTRNLPSTAVVGIRPEDLSGPVEAGQETLALKILVTEALGHSLLVHGNCGKERVVASLAPHTKAEMDTIAHFAVNLSAVHLFDPVTQEALL